MASILRIEDNIFRCRDPLQVVMLHDTAGAVVKSTYCTIGNVAKREDKDKDRPSPPHLQCVHAQKGEYYAL